MRSVDVAGLVGSKGSDDQEGVGLRWRSVIRGFHSPRLLRKKSKIAQGTMRRDLLLLDMGEETVVISKPPSRCEACDLHGNSVWHHAHELSRSGLPSPCFVCTWSERYWLHEALTSS